jgi:hypothetical protein
MLSGDEEPIRKLEDLLSDNKLAEVMDDDENDCVFNEDELNENHIHHIQKMM